MDLDPKKLWRSIGGSLPPDIPPAPAKERRAVWFADNASLGIPDPRTKSHPVIVLNRTGSLVIVVSGSHSYLYDLDAVTETFDADDLVEDTAGAGLSMKTNFDVCAPYSISDDTLGPYIGRLTQSAWERLQNARLRCDPPA